LWGEPNVRGGTDRKRNGKGRDVGQTIGMPLDWGAELE